VAKERLKSPRVRLFIALDLPERVREGLVAWGERELTDPALRVVPSENLHMTLAFLGYTAERDVGRVAGLLHATPGVAPEIALQREPVGRPEGRRPRLFAIDARSPETLEVQADIERRLAAERLYKPEKRPFWPHLTVARVRAEKGKPKHYREVKRPPGPLPPALLEPFRAVRLTLYRSTLRQAGAEYDPLAQLELPHGGKRGETDA
jgi:RNA 2',3'-cyclic 3'-phosphodiesterase